MAKARVLKPMSAAVEAIGEIARSQGDPKLLERGVVVDILLSYRAVEAWDEMVVEPFAYTFARPLGHMEQLTWSDMD